VAAAAAKNGGAKMVAYRAKASAFGQQSAFYLALQRKPVWEGVARRLLLAGL
jgi:hypothetical protein